MRVFFNRRNVLIATVAVALVANIAWRLLSSDPDEVPTKDQKPVSFSAKVDEIAPSLSSMALMGREWQQHIAALPPEAKARSAARLEEEKKFFMSLVSLSAEERNRQMRERLEALMNDPEAQAVVAGQRIKKFVKADASTRQKMMKGYVGYKSQVKPQ